jgi:hypothetical protein
MSSRVLSVSTLLFGSVAEAPWLLVGSHALPRWTLLRYAARLLNSASTGYHEEVRVHHPMRVLPFLILRVLAESIYKI